jgi:hypothetical protein
VYADPNEKFKQYESEDGTFGSGTACSKYGDGCKDFKEEFGSNLNKAARERCEADFGDCKKEQDRK